MKTRKVRVFCGFGATPRENNVKVWYTVPGHGYFTKLFQCTTCEAIFALDMDNPSLAHVSIDGILAQFTCVRCGTRYADGGIVEYPETFVHGGALGHFRPDPEIPGESESAIAEFVEIEPRVNPLKP